MEIKNTAGVSYRVAVDRVVKWKMHLIKSSQEDAFVHSKTLFVKSKIICTLFTSLKIFAGHRNYERYKKCKLSFRANTSLPIDDFRRVHISQL